MFYAHVPRARPQDRVVIKVITGDSRDIKSQIYTQTLTIFLDFKMDRHQTITQTHPGNINLAWKVDVGEEGVVPISRYSTSWTTHCITRLKITHSSITCGTRFFICKFLPTMGWQVLYLNEMSELLYSPYNTHMSPSLCTWTALYLKMFGCRCWHSCTHSQRNYASRWCSTRWPTLRRIAWEWVQVELLSFRCTLVHQHPLIIDMVVSMQRHDQVQVTIWSK